LGNRKAKIDSANPVSVNAFRDPIICDRDQQTAGTYEQLKSLTSEELQKRQLKHSSMRWTMSEGKLRVTLHSGVFKSMRKRSWTRGALRMREVESRQQESRNELQKGRATSFIFLKNYTGKGMGLNLTP
jgi:hypothetical protein